jgi:hypothetical protein
MRHRHPELLAVAWIITGLLVLVGTAGVLLVSDASTDRTPRIAVPGRVLAPTGCAVLPDHGG